ncbi:retrovirus-related Pol polyprotein from transposon opus [Trichonephila clavipes]|nr:retrovirus-related Pol polyprotein from transposon opus [Trichonephila clavipes]
MKQEIREWARTCIPCQKCKVHRHTKSKFGEYEVPDTRFSVIHIDLIGPLPPSQGMTFCMTCIDRFSCWMEAVPRLIVKQRQPAKPLRTLDSIPDKTTVPCKQSDDTNLLTDVKPTVSRHGRL